MSLLKDLQEITLNNMLRTPTDKHTEGNRHSEDDVQTFRSNINVNFNTTRCN